MRPDCCQYNEIPGSAVEIPHELHDGGENARAHTHAGNGDPDGGVPPAAEVEADDNHCGRVADSATKTWQNTGRQVNKTVLMLNYRLLIVIKFFLFL